VASSDDALVQDAARYLRCCHHHNPATAAARFPRIASAVAIWNDPATRETLQMLALADCPDEESAQRLNVSDDVIATAEGLFFDVRNRLTARVWILAHVLYVDPDGDAKPSLSRLMLAYYGGPVAIRLLLDAGSAAPLSQAESLCRLDPLLHIKTQEALDMPLTRKTQTRLLRAMMNHQLALRKFDLAKLKLQARMLQDERKFELAKAKLAQSQTPPDEPPPSPSGNVRDSNTAKIYPSPKIA
jgi:hypothetical protein